MSFPVFRRVLRRDCPSADEVIQKRILLKTSEAERELEQIYTANDSVLRNLFSFTDAILDIKGYNGAGEFARNFPFVPYQFILMQKVFAEIRKHGNSGKHLSGGERPRKLKIRTSMPLRRFISSTIRYIPSWTAPSAV